MYILYHPVHVRFVELGRTPLHIISNHRFSPYKQMVEQTPTQEEKHVVVPFQKSYVCPLQSKKSGCIP